MNSVVATSSILLAAAVVLNGCAHRQANPVDGHTLSIRECLRSRMSAEGFRMSDETLPGRPGRRLVGRSAGSTGPSDILSVWYTDSVFTMVGRTSQVVDRSLESAGDLPDGSRVLPKSARLRSLEAKLATECQGYQGPNPGVD